MLLKDSRPTVTQNKIYKNDCIGLFVRDKSVGKIEENKIENNKIELLVEKRNLALANIVENNWKKDAPPKGDIRIPQNYYNCNIF